MIKISANHDNHDNLRSIRYWQKMLLNPLSQQLKQLSKSSSQVVVTNNKSANYNGGQYKFQQIFYQLKCTIPF